MTKSNWDHSYSEESRKLEADSTGHVEEQEMMFLAHTRQANGTENLQQPKGSSLKEGDLERKWLPASHYQSVSGLCSGLRGRRVSLKISTHRYNLTQVPSLSLYYHMIRKKHSKKWFSNASWLVIAWGALQKQMPNPLGSSHSHPGPWEVLKDKPNISMP